KKWQNWTMKNESCKNLTAGSFKQRYGLLSRLLQTTQLKEALANIEILKGTIEELQKEKANPKASTLTEGDCNDEIIMLDDRVIPFESSEEPVSSNEPPRRQKRKKRNLFRAETSPRERKVMPQLGGLTKGTQTFSESRNEEQTIFQQKTTSHQK